MRRQSRAPHSSWYGDKSPTNAIKTRRLAAYFRTNHAIYFQLRPVLAGPCQCRSSRCLLYRVYGSVASCIVPRAECLPAPFRICSSARYRLVPPMHRPSVRYFPGLVRISLPCLLPHCSVRFHSPLCTARVWPETFLPCQFRPVPSSSILPAVYCTRPARTISPGQYRPVPPSSILPTVYCPRPVRTVSPRSAPPCSATSVLPAVHCPRPVRAVLFRSVPPCPAQYLPAFGGLRRSKTHEPGHCPQSKYKIR